MAQSVPPEPMPEVHAKGCLPSSCAPDCPRYVPRPPELERERDIIDDAQSALGLLWDVATVPPAEVREVEPGKLQKTGGLLDGIFRALGVK